MNKFVSSLSPTTANGAVTLSTSDSACLDLFSMIGAASNANQVVSLFKLAYQENMEYALRILFWSRDCRGGAGRRLGFKAILNYLADRDPILVSNIIHHIPEYGRFDDMLDLLTKPNLVKVVSQYLGIAVSENALAAKWMPREKSAQRKYATILMREWGMSSKEYRKFLVDRSDTVETKMCAKEFDKIEYSHVPSVAMSRYIRAFKKNDPVRFDLFLNRVKEGTAKINASVLYPHDCARALKDMQTFSEVVTSDAIDLQWKALPNYIPEGVSILPIVDVSGSMATRISGNVQAIDVASSLGIYLAERQKSAFNGVFITFDDCPKMCKIESDSFSKNYHDVMNADWGGSTDFVASMRLILSHAVRYEIPKEDMPDYLMCISDMEFNLADRCLTNFEVVKREFNNMGYDLPTLVFWNVNARSNNVQTEEDERGVIMISGFSPSAVSAILSGNAFTPELAMIDTICQSRYDIVGVTVK